MTQRTCELCGVPLTGRQARFCCDLHKKRVHKREARERGARWAQNADPATRKTTLTCSHCSSQYVGYRSAGPEHKRNYCSAECDAAAKRERYTTCTHGTGRTGDCPACTFLARTNGQVAWRDVLRRDPCSYCDTRPSNGIDHIDSAARQADRSDTANWTGCCKRCNELKSTVPLLLALHWIPAAREYHTIRRELFTAA